MKQFLSHVTGMEGYLIFSMMVFLIFFLVLLWWVFTADKNYITKMKQMPLEDSDSPLTINNNHI
jgi:cytochrome c oxidase cbb3-type subunit 4